MPAATAVRTVQAVCACGATFSREVKRGRPQVWCPACREVPFYERTVTAKPEAAPVVVSDAPVAPPKPRNPNDRYSHVRDQIEAQVAELNAAWPARFHALVADGKSHFDASTVLADDLRAIYAQFRPLNEKQQAEATE